MKVNILTAFYQFPEYSFIWKIQPDNETQVLIGKHRNVFSVEWIEQRTVLSDKRIKAFITHCGLNSIIEATFSAVPMITIPFFNDQHLNAALVLNRKTSVFVDKDNLNAGTLTEALRKILTDTTYSTNARQLSEKLRNNPTNVSDIFVKYIEYAASFESNAEMDLGGQDLDLIAYYNIDIYVPIGLILLLITYFVVRISKRIVLSLLSSIIMKTKLE